MPAAPAPRASTLPSIVVCLSDQTTAVPPWPARPVAPTLIALPSLTNVLVALAIGAVWPQRVTKRARSGASARTAPPWKAPPTRTRPPWVLPLASSWAPSRRTSLPDTSMRPPMPVLERAL